jgi:hypothetical protein
MWDRRHHHRVMRPKLLKHLPPPPRRRRRHRSVSLAKPLQLDAGRALKDPRNEA